MTAASRTEDVGSPVHAVLRRVVDIRGDEVRAVLTSFAFFFFLLSAYFMLRPIRDAVAAASGVSKLKWLFAGSLGATLACNPFFSWLVVRVPVRRVLPIAYSFFLANILTFYTVLRFVSTSEGSTTSVWMGRVFFVWTTVFALFNTSMFWCLMADVFRSEQAKRLFGFIGVGGTLGSIAGSAATASLANAIGAVNVLLVSATLLTLAITTIVRFPLLGRGDPRAPGTRVGRQGDVIGGSVWSGFSAVTKSPYLLGICAFQILYTVGSTFLYAEQSDIVGRFYVTATTRTAVLAKLELAAQVLTVVTQIFLTGRVIRWIGLAMALALLPLVSILGFGAMSVLPVFATLAIFTVARRGMNFAITNPTMEVLFTVVPREDKYKAKNIIETFIYRGGDQLGIWTYDGLTALGLSLAGISFVAVPLSAIWLGLGLWLGRKQAALAQALTGSLPPRLSEMDSQTDQPLPTATSAAS